MRPNDLDDGLLTITFQIIVALLVRMDCNPHVYTYTYNAYMDVWGRAVQGSVRTV